MVNSHSDIVKTLSSSLANPYSTLTPHYPTQTQHVNAQGYAYSSTYNPLAVPSTSFNYVSSNSSNSRPSRAAPVMHWCTPGKSKCTYFGCTFTGSANSVEIHMMDRHLIYPPGWHTRKHQPDWDTDPSLKGKPIPILGTNVRLDTPQDIEAWIAERKHRWPTTARVAEKKRKLEEAIASGGGALQLHHHMNNPAFARNNRLRPPFRDAEASRTNRGRGRDSFGRGRGRGSAAGRGRGQRPGRHDAGPMAVTSAPTTLPSPMVAERQPCVPPATVDTSHLDLDSASDNDAPEVLSARRPPGIEDYESSIDAEPGQPHDHSPLTPPIPPLGTAGIAGSSHVHATVPAAAQPPTVVKEHPANYPRRAPPPQPKRPPRNPFAPRSSLLRNLLLPEIRMTVSNLSQAIHFLVENDFLENVELEPGQATEKRIEVVGEQTTQAETETSILEDTKVNPM